MKNGRVNGSGPDEEPGRDPKIASLDEARKRAAVEKARREQRMGKGGGQSARGTAAPRSTRDLVVGGILLLMAVAMILTWLAPLFRAAAPAR